jgi:hypothetical protein
MWAGVGVQGTVSVRAEHFGMEFGRAMRLLKLLFAQVTRQLRMDGWPALSIHGDKSQQERDWVLNEFRTGNSPIMTATDVAARGLGSAPSRCAPAAWLDLVNLVSECCISCTCFADLIEGQPQSPRSPNISASP